MVEYKKIALKVLEIVGVCIAVILAILMGVYFWPFLIAIVFAVLLEKVVNSVVTKTKLSRKLVGTVFVALTFAIIGLVAYFIVSSLISEAIVLSGNLPDIIENIKNEYNDAYIQLNDALARLPDTVNEKLHEIGLDFIGKITTFASGVITGIIDFVLFFPHIMIYIIVTFLATLFLVTDRRTISRGFNEILPAKYVKKITEVVKACLATLGKYLKAQCILICITFLELLLAFTLLKQPYPLLLALIVAIIDALPILGTGTVLLPWAVYSAITGNIAFGIKLLVVYIIITIVRQLVEPRVVSEKIGVHPFVTLIVMYLGFKIFGLFGLVIGPCVMIIFKNVFDIMYKK